MPFPLRPNWKLVLAYDGTGYRGWQVQPGQLTIQGELASALRRVTGEELLPQGSGRTDAGVHALAQVASFRMDTNIPASNLMRALNRTLPADIRIRSAEQVASDFHARHSAVAKSYEYRVLVCDPFTQVVCPPWMSRFVYAVERPPDLSKMQEAAAFVTGDHDFTSFAAFDPDRAQRAAAWPPHVNASPVKTNVRTIHTSSWSMEPNDSCQPFWDAGGEAATLFVYRVRGSGFLHHMVRNLVGTFLDVGWGWREAGHIPAILRAHDRGAAGRTAPAQGLFLHDVEYATAAADSNPEVLR